MATQFYLVDADPAGPTVTGYVNKSLSTTIGSGTGIAANGTPTSGGNHIEVDSSTGPFIWLFQCSAVTISGTISVEICGAEAGMTDNVQPAVRIVRVSPAGSILSDVVANANANHAKGVEFTTSLARVSWTITPTSTAFSSGDWIGFIAHGDAIGTMGSGSASVWCRYNGSNANTSDSNVTFTEAITAGTPAAGGFPFQRPSLFSHTRR